MSDRILEEIHMYRHMISLHHYAGIGITLIASSLVSIPIIFAVPAINSYGVYVIIGASALYILCMIINILKWCKVVSHYKTRIKKRKQLLLTNNPFHMV